MTLSSIFLKLSSETLHVHLFINCSRHLCGKSLSNTPHFLSFYQNKNQLEMFGTVLLEMFVNHPPPTCDEQLFEYFPNVPSGVLC